MKFGFSVEDFEREDDPQDFLLSKDEAVERANAKLTSLMKSCIELRSDGTGVWVHIPSLDAETRFLLPKQPLCGLLFPINKPESKIKLAGGI